MINFVDAISNKLVIIGIETITAVLLTAAFFYTQKIYRMTKRTTDIWLLISFVIFTSFLVSLSNALKWYYDSETFHVISEYLRNIYYLVWIYIAFRFISLRKIETKV